MNPLLILKNLTNIGSYSDAEYLLKLTRADHAWSLSPSCCLETQRNTRLSNTYKGWGSMKAIESPEVNIQGAWQVRHEGKEKTFLP